MRVTDDRKEELPMTNRRQVLFGLAPFLGLLLAGSRFRGSGVAALRARTSGSDGAKAAASRKPSRKVYPPLHSVKRRG